MPSLKEIRARITSVASTQKITSAMKMVSAAKLKKTEGKTLSFIPYRNKLNEALCNYLGAIEGEVTIPLAEHRDVKRVALLAFTSDSGLCGVYNASIVKLFRKTYDDYSSRLGTDNVDVYLFGKKINEYAEKNGIAVRNTYRSLESILFFDFVTELGDMLMKQFINHETDSVAIIFNHFKNAGVQTPLCETLLPLEPQAPEPGKTFDYLVEPSKETFINALVPKVIRAKLYSVMLDALTAEHAARMTAMHIASDNADTLLQELKTQYNKARQNVITTELIDIVGGAEALNS